MNTSPEALPPIPVTTTQGFGGRMGASPAEVDDLPVAGEEVSKPKIAVDDEGWSGSVNPAETPSDDS